MNVTSRRMGDDLIVEIGEERIDASVAIQFKDAVRSLIPAEMQRVILDLSAVRFLDSSGLGAVVAIMKLLAPDQRLDLAAATPMVAKVFELTRMDKVFRIYPTVDAALSAEVQH